METCDPNLGINWMEEIWVEFANVFNIYKLKQLYNLEDDMSIEYFTRIQNLILFMQLSLHCKNIQLKYNFDEWALNYRERFQKCDSLSPEHCSHCCYLDDVTKSCKSKPMLLVFDDLIKSFCGMNSVYNDDVQFIHEYLNEIYKMLFNNEPNFHGHSTCEEIITMFNDIKETLKNYMGTSLRWSQIKDFTKIPEKTWQNLWTGTNSEKQLALYEISQLKEDDLFIEAIKKLGVVLSFLKV